MNNKVTLNKIIKILSERSGKSPQMCEDVLKGLFKHIASSLEEGETIKIKGFGTFKLSRVESRKSVDVTNGQENEIPAHDRIVFVPSKELASAVNVPFEMFETIELDEEILEEELAKAEVAGESLLAQEYGSQLIIDEEKEDDLLKEHPDLKKIVEADSKEEPEEQTVDVQEEKEEPTAEELPAEKEPPKDEELLKEETSAEVAPSEEKLPAEEEIPAEMAMMTEEESPDEKEKTADEDESDEDESDEDESDEDESDEDESDEDESNKEYYYEPTYYSQNNKGSFRHGFLWGVLGALLLFILGLFALWMLNDDFAEWGKSMFSRSGSNVEVGSADTVRVENPADSSIANEESEILMQENDLSEAEAGVPDIVEDASVENAVPTAPSDKAEKAAQNNKSTAGPVYDTITTTHYLTTMAKKHYGNYHLWPYIYKENSKILGHPNRIRPGTKVVIPDLKKYGVDPNNPKDIEKARRLGTEIYKKYE